MTNSAPIEVMRSIDGKPNALVVVDFDETLLLANSTILYLASARPKLLRYALCKLVDIFKLWSLGSGRRKEFYYRNWLKVLIVTILMPWTLPIWKRFGARRAVEVHSNTELVKAISRGGNRTIVASFGFRIIIEPMLAFMLPEAKLVSSNLMRGFSLRRAGKLAAIKKIYTAEEIKDAIAITDSAENDKDVLNAVGNPMVVQWPGTEIRSPFRSMYLPFYYTHCVKRRGENYLLRGFLFGDFLAAYLAFGLISANPFIAAFSILFLQTSMWLVYELGYAENDKMALEREAKRNVPKYYFEGIKRVRPTLSAWLFSSTFGVVGVYLTVMGDDDLSHSFFSTEGYELGGFLLGCVIWLLFLVGVRGFFYFYNSSDVAWRYALYPFLQVLRLCGVGVFLTTSVVGFMLLLAFTFGRWIPYVIYRVGSVRWYRAIKTLVLVSFLTMLPFAVATKNSFLLSVQGIIILAWLTIRSWKEIRSKPG